ncbi:N-6 DNA methylase [Leucobacter coleopterorum]|uniref:N-6 DNA methylase n=1 Tax=Leucobacter coleopterorum TaxID=2714933 RepID=UPI001FCBA9A2
MVDRVERTFSEDDIQRIAGTFRNWRGRDSAQGEYEDVPGFCKSATLDEIEAAGWALTPGRYVGAPEAPEDSEPIDEKIARLTKSLTEALDESARLDAVVREQLGRLS